MEIPQAITDLMGGCIQCGRCQTVCPSYRHGGTDPKAVMDGDFKSVVKCIGCGSCTKVCENTDPWTVMMNMKCRVLGLSVPKIFTETGLVMPKSEVSRSELKPDWGGDGVYVMPGCTVEGRAPYLTYASSAALRALGIGCDKIPFNACCTYPVPFRSITDGERDVFKVRIGDSAEGKDIVSICPGCSSELRRSGVESVGITNHLAHFTDKISSLGRVKLRVALEPGCHREELIDDLRAVAKATGADVMDNVSGCCGKTVEGVRDGLMAERQAEVAGADVIIVSCPMCFSMYDNFAGGKPVMHIVELVALASGDSSSLKFHKIPVPLNRA